MEGGEKNNYLGQDNPIADQGPSLMEVWQLKSLGDGGWRDGSVVKSTDCSSEGPEFKSQ